MSDKVYDNQNSGVIFRPHPDQQFAGQGKLNIRGVDHKVVTIKEPLKADGEPVYALYVRVGPLFPNDSENEAAPNFSGPMDGVPAFADLRCAAWSRMKDGKPYMSLAVSARREGGGRGTDQSSPAGNDYGMAPEEDEIPF